MRFLLFFTSLIIFSQTLQANPVLRLISDTPEDHEEMYGLRVALHAEKQTESKSERYEFVDLGELEPTLQAFHEKTASQTEVIRILKTGQTVQFTNASRPFLCPTVNEISGFYLLYNSEEDRERRSPVGFMYLEPEIDSGFLEESILCLSTATKGLGQWAIQQTTKLFDFSNPPRISCIQPEDSEKTLSLQDVQLHYLAANIEYENLPSLFAHLKAGYRPAWHLRVKPPKEDLKRGLTLTYPPLNYDTYAPAFPEAYAQLIGPWKTYMEILIPHLEALLSVPREEREPLLVALKELTDQAESLKEELESAVATDAAAS